MAVSDRAPTYADPLATHKAWRAIWSEHGKLTPPTIPGLKITPSLPSLMQTIIANTVTAVVAPTGTGKTAQIPPLCAMLFGTCWVTVPNRTSTRIHTWVQGHYPSLSVGWAAHSVKTYTRTTQVVYMTTGHLYHKLLNLLIKARAGKHVHLPDCLMIDESHHPSADNYALLKLVKWLKTDDQLKHLLPRLVVSSATANIEAFRVDFPRAAVATIGDPSYPVSIRYLPDDPTTNKLHSRNLNGRLKTAGEEALKYSKALVDSGSDGTVLVFVPGVGEAESVMDILYEDTDPRVADVRVCPLHSGLSAKQIEEAAGELQGGVIRITVATNIAESSLTIKDVRFVIDTLHNKVCVLV
jgi:ATP-dependent helicase HrpA